MQSSVAPLEGNTVKVSVEIDEVEFDRDLDAAFRKIAQEVRLPGFRPGKAPRKVLEARVGLAPARQQAIQDAVPQYLARAVREHEVDIIAPADIDLTGGADSGPITFNATIQVRPKVMVPGYSGLRVEMPSPVVTDEEAEAPINNELRRHGGLVDVGRPAVRGDQVTVDLAATRDGEPVPGLNTEDWLYEIGNGWVAAGFDEELIGTEPGDTKNFTSLPSGTDEPAEFVVHVKRVQELQLPEIDDDWVADNVEGFSSVEAWKTSVRDRITLTKRSHASRSLVERATTELSELVLDDLPDSLIDHDFQGRVQTFVQQLQSQGIQLEQYMAITGQDQQKLIDSLRDASRRAVKVDLALRAVIEAEGIDITDEEVEAEYERIATTVREKPAAVRKAYVRNDAVGELRVELRKRKALDVILDRVEVVDPEGQPIDRSLLMLSSGSDDVVGGDDSTDDES